MNCQDIPKDPNSMSKYIQECQNIVQSNLDQYTETISKLGRTIESQNEIIESQNKTIEQVEEAYRKRFKKQDDESFSEVTRKVMQAISAIFFFFTAPFLCCGRSDSISHTNMCHLDIQ